MDATERPDVQLNGVTYRWPSRPVVVVCIDGGDPRYLDQGLKDNILPNIGRFMKEGFSAIADGVVPSFTNPNNISIITGSPPAVHGISANFFIDPETGTEVMMNDPKFIWSDTLLGEFSKNGKVVSITAKDKLRRVLGKDMDFSGGSVNFSSEKADRCTMAENGIENVLDLVGLPLPEVYSADLSLFAMEAGVKLLERERPDLMYLSLTDYIQHKHAPGDPVSDDFYARLDDAFGRLEALGAVVALIADHGMNDKAKADGSPNAIFLQDILDAEFGPGAAKVHLTITDPYVVHHGALGGFVGVYCTGAVTPGQVMDFAGALPGVEAVYDRDAACAAFALPAERQPDVAVISDAATVIGSSAAAHDLSGLEGHRLRSHGGIAERRVPFILSAPLNTAYAARAAKGGLDSYEIFDYAINGTA